MDGRDLQRKQQLKELELENADLHNENSQNTEPQGEIVDFDFSQLEDEIDEDELPIEFYVENVDFPFDEPQTERLVVWLTAAAAAEGREIGQVSFIFCDDEYLLQMNQLYLQHDYYTDVITFSYHESADEPLVGDVYISVERTTDNARTLSVAPMHELNRVMVHGVLHLCGYDDATDDLRAAMSAKEDYYLAKLELKA